MSHTNKNHFRIKKTGMIDDVAIWLVDGGLIRKDLNENFVQSGDCTFFSFVPVDEFWIDVNTDFREHRFFIDRFFTKRTLMKNGTTQKKAEHIGAILEQHEREQSLPGELLELKDTQKKLVEKIHKKHFTPYHSDKLSIWIVDGKLVRDLIFLEYDAGGHDRVYSWIPEQEIWIEEALSEKERHFVLLHELHERFLMGEGKNYTHAHQGATIIEDRFRDHLEGLEARIHEEISRNLAR